MQSEDVVVEYVQGVRPVPPDMVRLVAEYNRRRKIVDECASYPRHVEDGMNVLYDAMVVMEEVL